MLAFFGLVIVAVSAKSPGATVPATVASAGGAGYSQQNTKVATMAPASWTRMNPGASVGRMPAKVLLALRAKVTAGLANEGDAVNQYAAVKQGQNGQTSPAALSHTVMMKSISGAPAAANSLRITALVARHVAPRSARVGSGRYHLCNRRNVLYFPFSETPLRRR